METIARGQDLANQIDYHDTIAPSTGLPIIISLLPTSFRLLFKVYQGGGGKVEPYITQPRGGLMEQGYTGFAIHSNTARTVR